MYQMLDRASQRAESESRFAAQVGQAEATATLVSLRAVRVGDVTGNAISVRMIVDTRIWGTLREVLTVPLTTTGSDPRIHLGPTLLFPGLVGHERLHRTIVLPPRATLLASDGTPLAEGPTRSSPIPDVAGQIVGTVGPIPAGEIRRLRRPRIPARRPGGAGRSRAHLREPARRPAGRPAAGRSSHAGQRRARSRPRPCTTTISPTLERAAVAAMGGKYAGIAVMNPRTGALVALAGIAFSALQPPGSTMKIVTAAGALQAGIAKLSTVYPIQSATTLSGVQLQNASGESCGGTLLNAFAVSCNSVFAPLGARLGARRLVAIAERFGFNQPSSILGAAEPTIPAASAIGDDLAVGSSAIGQGLVQATPLAMADVGSHHRDGRPAADPHPAGPSAAAVRPRGQRPRRPRGAADDDRRGAVRDRRRRPDPRGRGRRQDGNRRAEEHHPARAERRSEHGRLVCRIRPRRPSPLSWPRALFPNQGAGGATAAPPIHDVLAAALERSPHPAGHARPDGRASGTRRRRRSGSACPESRPRSPRARRRPR